MSTQRFSGIVHNGPDGQLIHLPLDDVRVHARIVDVSATVTLTQVFHNSSNTVTARAKYIFPVPGRSAVCAFEMRTEDGRIIAGVAKESQQAAKEHQDAIQEGKLTSLVDWATDDIFTISLGSLPAEQRLTTKLTYIMDLMDDSRIDQVRFQIPMVVGERYGELPDGMVGASSPASTTRVRITTNIQMAGAISEVISPTHPEVTVTPYQRQRGSLSSRRSIAKYRSSEFLRSDFVLSIRAEGLDRSRCFVERDPRTGSTAIQLTLVPKLELPPIASQEYIFVVDRSGSMSQENRIDIAKKTLVMLLCTLPRHGTSFNIVSFGSLNSMLFGCSVAYNQQHLTEACSHADSMDADYGGTEIRSALKRVFDTRNRSLPTAVFVLTDGEVFDFDGTISDVTFATSQARPDAPLRVFTLGIGNTASSAMCGAIARAGNGICLMTTSSEGIMERCFKLFRAGRTFILQNVSINWGIPPDLLAQSQAGTSVRFSSRDDLLRQAPYQVEAIYPGNRLIVFALINHTPFQVPSEVVLRGKRDGEGEDIEIRIPIDIVKFADEEPRIPFIHVLTARRLIMDLEDRFLPDPSSAGDLKQSLVKLGVQYQLANRFTSFVAVEGVQTRLLSERRRRASRGSLRGRNSESSLRESIDPDPALGSLTYLLQLGADYASSFLTAFAGAWFDPPRSYPLSRYPTGYYRSPSPSDAGTGNEQHEDGEYDEDDDTNDDDESIRTFTTLSSLESSSDSDWSDLEDDRIRGRQPSPTPADNPIIREPSPDFRHPGGDTQRPGTFPQRQENASPSTPPPPPVSESIVELVRLQSFDGSFSLDGQLGNIVGSDALQSGRDLGVDDTVWATVLAVAYFRKHLINQPDLLQGLEEKSFEFAARSVLPAGVDFTALLEKAKDLIR